MKNWAEKYEKKQDDLRENELNYQLKKLLELVDETYKNNDMIKVLTAIIEKYDELKREACDYDEKDYIAKKKQLAEIRYIVLKQQHEESIEAQSWKEYRDEEKLEEKEEEER